MHSRDRVVKAWTPWVILTVVAVRLGLPQVKSLAQRQGIALLGMPIAGLAQASCSGCAPAVAAADDREPRSVSGASCPRPAPASCSRRSVAGFVMGFKFSEMVKTWAETFGIMKYLAADHRCDAGAGLHSRATAGMDGTLGLAFANTGWLYPFFGTLIGWIGVALTGSDTASNALFGSQQEITANSWA